MRKNDCHAHVNGLRTLRRPGLRERALLARTAPTSLERLFGSIKFANSIMRAGLPGVHFLLVPWFVVAVRLNLSGVKAATDIFQNTVVSLQGLLRVTAI